mmetsp:Transcript_16634/g.14535  ORF Transcript_16634/g.14535 Transcript_16634/m.14535 type:complete len:107 (-) Transcript_16634:3-323(-)
MKSIFDSLVQPKYKPRFGRSSNKPKRSTFHKASSTGLSTFNDPRVNPIYLTPSEVNYERLLYAEEAKQRIQKQIIMWSEEDYKSIYHSIPHIKLTGLNNPFVIEEN